jgi:hypothetical protein
MKYWFCWATGAKTTRRIGEYNKDWRQLEELEVWFVLEEEW